MAERRNAESGGIGHAQALSKGTLQEISFIEEFPLELPLLDQDDNAVLLHILQSGLGVSVLVDVPHGIAHELSFAVEFEEDDAAVGEALLQIALPFEVDRRVHTFSQARPRSATGLAVNLHQSARARGQKLLRANVFVIFALGTATAYELG